MSEEKSWGEVIGKGVLAVAFFVFDLFLIGYFANYIRDHKGIFFFDLPECNNAELYIIALLIFILSKQSVVRLRKE